MTGMGAIVVDHTHCGRHVTGLERITLELFSREALAPLPIEIHTSSGVLDMVVRQTLALPWRLASDRRCILVCPGFPPSPLASLFGGRVLPYIHDTFLITRREDLNPRARLYMAPSFRFALKRLPRFLVNSETTRDEARRFCRPDAEITLYRPGIRNVFGLACASRARKPFVATRLRLVALGTVEPRKNLLAAAGIVKALRDKGLTDATLDVVGRAGWGDDAKKLTEAPGVVMHGYQPMERVREIVEAADMLISTSFDEGLGLPLLEAQYAGLPVVAPDKPVFREVLGESGLLIDASAAGAAAERILALVSTPDWRERYVKLATANLERWLALAARDKDVVLDLVEKLARGNHSC